MTRGLNAQLDARALAARALSRVERAASHTVAEVDADADDAAQDNAHDNAQGLEGAQLLCAFLPELLTDLLTNTMVGDEVGGGGALRFDDDAELTGAMLSSEGPGVGGGGAPIPRLDTRAVVGILAQLLGRSSRPAPIPASVPAETTAMRSGATQLQGCALAASGRRLFRPLGAPLDMACAPGGAARAARAARHHAPRELCAARSPARCRLARAFEPGGQPCADAFERLLPPLRRRRAISRRVGAAEGAAGAERWGPC